MRHILVDSSLQHNTQNLLGDSRQLLTSRYCLIKPTLTLNGDKAMHSVQGTISLKLLGGKLAPKLVYFVLRKELLKP